MLELSRTLLNGPNDIHFWTYLSGIMQVCSFHAHVSQRIYLTLVNCAHKRLQNFESSLPHCEFVESVTKSKYGFRYLLCLKKISFSIAYRSWSNLAEMMESDPTAKFNNPKDTVPFLRCFDGAGEGGGALVFRLAVNQ